MRSIEKVTIGNNSFYFCHKNYLISMVGESGISKLGGVEFSRSYNVYFLQNPKNAINALVESGAKISPKSEMVRNMLHTDTVCDIPWIHSRVGSIGKVLVTDVEFGEIIESVSEVYKNPNIDVIVGDSAFDEVIAKCYSNTRCVESIETVLNDRSVYDAIFIGKTTANSIDYENFAETYYKVLGYNGEIILILDSELLKSSYESYESFRNLFNEFGYASSIKNIGALTNDLVLHIRKNSPDYSEVTAEDGVYPNIYVQSLISRIEKDPILHISLKRIPFYDRERAIYKLIYNSRINNFMYLPKVEDHVNFINTHIENYSSIVV